MMDTDWFHRANGLFIDEKFTRAHELYTKVIENSASSVSELDDVYSKRAAVRLKLKQYEGALEDAVQALKLNEKRCISHFRKG